MAQSARLMPLADGGYRRQGWRTRLYTAIAPQVGISCQVVLHGTYVWRIVHRHLRHSSKVHYPVSLHRQPAYKYLGVPEGSLPVPERVAAPVLSLPIYPELSRDQIEIVSRAVIEAASAERLEARRACAFSSLTLIIPRS
jgi:hypothetical protein